MDWNGDGSSRVARKDHDMVTADNPVGRESGARQGANDPAPVHDRQLSVGHTQAATVTLRISGIASGGIARP